MESSTIEVQFAADYVNEDLKKKAFCQFKENNQRIDSLLGVTTIDAQGRNGLCVGDAFTEFTLSLKDLAEKSCGFAGAIEALRSGNAAESEALASELEVVDKRSPVIAFCPRYIDQARQEVLKEENILPWTSVDSITIFPIN